ncbi:hypothetical protein ACHBTE_00480 [Streptomyces sp. M41]|uniref:hypothetical protein n=1 Tax=Streptomyces sp. M41 TaxID=3059412 RepID=UPI00374D1B57
MSVSGPLRVVRAAVFAAVCVVLATVGHAVMSGAGLPWWMLLSGTAAVAAVGWVFGAQERRRRTVAALTVAIQACLHVGFTLAQPHSGGHTSAASAGGGTQSVRQWVAFLLCGPNPTPAQAARAYDIAVQAGLTHRMHAAAAHGDTGAGTSVGHDMASMPGMHDMSQMTGTASWGMLAAHVLAAVLCGLWLAQGERAAFALLRACADRAFVPLRLVLAVLRPLPRPAALRPYPHPRQRMRQALLVHSLTTRGPPGTVAVL